MWQLKSSRKVDKKIQKLEKRDTILFQRIWTGIEQLADSDRPEKLGARKTGHLTEYYAWEVGRNCRIVYKPYYEEQILYLHRVCSHKEVYQ